MTAIDPEARQDAALARQAIEDHKEACATRYAGIERGINGLYRRIWWLLTTSLIGMVSILASIHYQQ